MSAVSGVLALSGTSACSSDDNGTTTPTGGDDAGSTVDATQSTVDSSTGTGVDSSTSGHDSGSGQDSSSGGNEDAGDAGPTLTDGGTDAADSATPAFCANQTGLAFCADFDESTSIVVDPDAGDNLAWGPLSAGSADYSVSTAESVSTPNSFAVSISDPLADGGGDHLQSVKLVNQQNPAGGLSQAIYEFDVFIASSATGSDGPGGFMCDFQFEANDVYGFRLGVFGNATGFDHADWEHNADVIGGLGNSVSNVIPFTFGAWQHVKMVVAFSAATDDAGAGILGQAEFQLYLNHSATAQVDQTFPAPTATVDFARITTGIAYAFNGGEKTWGLYYDNVTLKIQ